MREVQDQTGGGGNLRELPRQTPFSRDETLAINFHLGLGNQGVLPYEQMPSVINVSRWWQDTLPTIMNHPTDRELFIGCDLINGKLSQTEVVEGPSCDQIEQATVRHGNVVVVYIGMVTPKQEHPLVFHTHILLPESVRQMRKTASGRELSPMERYLDEIPHSHTEDMGSLLFTQKAYAMIVVDVSTNVSPRPVEVVFKTIDTPRITAENYQKYKRIFDGIEQEEYWDFAVNPRMRYRDLLSMDRRWVKKFKVAFYRGYLSVDLTQPQFIRRSDVRFKQ